jgi:hypothetical protein
MYLTFEEYEDMGGTLDEATFGIYIIEAAATVDNYTYGRLKKDTAFSDSVKRCIFKIISLIDKREQAIDGKTVSSQSNDGVSISYNVVNAAQMIDNTKQEAMRAMKTFLFDERNEAGKLLLYRGLYSDE